MLRVGLIGCGEIAQIMYIPYLVELPEMELVALCRRSEEVLHRVADRFGIERRFTDYRDLLAQDDIDAVVVTTFFEHMEVTVAAAEEGKHVLVEKPLCFSLEEADQMISACERNGVKLMLAEMKRYDPGYQYAQDLIRETEDINFIRVHNFAHYSPIINDEVYDLDRPDSKGQERRDRPQQNAHFRTMERVLGTDRRELLEAYFWLVQTGVHDIEILRGAFGSPEEVLHTDIFHPMPGSWDYFITSLLQYGKNVRCIFELGNTRRKWCDEEIVAYSPRETITVSFLSPYLKNNPTLVSRRYMHGTQEHEVRVTTSYDESFKRELRHFHDCVVQDRTPVTDGMEGRRDIELAIRMMKKHMETHAG
jgi:predicted dehydrogenase